MYLKKCAFANTTKIQHSVCEKAGEKQWRYSSECLERPTKLTKRWLWRVESKRDREKERRKAREREKKIFYIFLKEVCKRENIYFFKYYIEKNYKKKIRRYCCFTYVFKREEWNLKTKRLSFDCVRCKGSWWPQCPSFVRMSSETKKIHARRRSTNE